jgi:hypothetical protein
MKRAGHDTGRLPPSFLLTLPNRLATAYFWQGLGVLLLVAAIAGRWPDRNGFFQTDDFLWLNLAHWRSVAASFAGPFGGAQGALLAYRPIFRVSVYIDALLFGHAAIWWHFENLAIHAGNAFLFAPHNSESVDWLSGRTAALGFLFMQLAAWRWVWAVREHRTPWAAAIWMLLGAGTYEAAITLPFVLLCLIPLVPKTLAVDWRYAGRQVIMLIGCLAVFLIVRAFMLGTFVGQTAATNMDLLANSLDHFVELGRADLATGSVISRLILAVALILTSFHPRLFPAGPCLLGAANVLLLPFITTPGAGSRFFYMLQAPLCVMAVLPVLIAPARFRLPLLTLLLLIVLPGFVASSWHEAAAMAAAGGKTRAIFEAVHRAIPANLGYANVIDGVPETDNGRLMAGGFFEEGIADTYHDPVLPPPFIARSEAVLANPELRATILRVPARFWRYDPDSGQITPNTREAWLSAHREALQPLLGQPVQ